MPMTVTFDDEDLPVLRQILDRAMNTWEPKLQPPMLVELSDRLDMKLGVYLPRVTAAPVTSLTRTGSATDAARSEQ